MSTDRARESDFEFVRVSRELVEQLTDGGESEPLVLVALDRRRDGTSELWFKTPPRSLVSLDDVVQALHGTDLLDSVEAELLGRFLTRELVSVVPQPEQPA